QQQRQHAQAATTATAAANRRTATAAAAVAAVVILFGRVDDGHHRVGHCHAVVVRVVAGYRVTDGDVALPLGVVRGRADLQPLVGEPVAGREGEGGSIEFQARVGREGDRHVGGWA